MRQMLVGQCGQLASSSSSSSDGGGNQIGIAIGTKSGNTLELGDRIESNEQSNLRMDPIRRIDSNKLTARLGPLELGLAGRISPKVEALKVS